MKIPFFFSWVKKNIRETYGGDEEGGIVSNLLEATNERPWLWVLFVIVVILPFVLIAACCFPGSKVNVVLLSFS